LDAKYCTRKRKQQKYVLKNNSERTINKFYIEHVADSSHGGFVIVTKENCSKSVTGFSRFEFTLSPQQEVQWVVTERANYSETISSTSELTSFILRRAPALLATSVLKKEDLSALKHLVRTTEIITSLYAVESENFTDRDVQKWHTGSTVDVESGGLIHAELSTKLLKLLELNAKLTEVSRTIHAGNERIKVIFQNQQRLRENIKSLENMVGSELVKRYLGDLDKEEDDLEKARLSIEKNEAIQATLASQIGAEKVSAAEIAKKKREEIEANN